ncbi:hypothetical protein JCM1840_004256 [Sporobolomyces johnsonii]
MLSHLPNELVQRIIELSIPPCSVDSRSTYWRRQGALRTYCLVSRRLRDLAQPLLFAVVELTRPQQVGALLSGLRGTGLGTAIKTLHLYQDRSGHSFESDKVERLLAEATSLKELALSTGQTELNLSSLANHAELERLILSLDDFIVREPFMLPGLVELSIFESVAPPQHFATLLSSSTLPGLQALAVHNCELYDALFRPAPLGIPCTLLSQLDMVSLSAIDTDTLPVDPAQTSVPILLDVNLDPSRNSAPMFQRSNVRLVVDLEVDGLDELLDALELYLTANATILRLLYLPRLFGDLVTYSPVQARRLQTILETHLPEVVEVVYEDTPYVTPRSVSLSSLISPDFWARARAMKAEAE